LTFQNHYLIVEPNIVAGAYALKINSEMPENLLEELTAKKIKFFNN
jgi:hypothetical protein